MTAAGPVLLAGGAAMVPKSACAKVPLTLNADSG